VKVALVLNGEEPGPDELKLLSACEAIVCADGAAQAMLKSNKTPTVIVGDLDSLKADAYKWAEALEVPIERHKPEKDLTDGELALEKCFALGATGLIIMGGHGGRSAMFLHNLKLLRRAFEKGLEASMVGRGESLRFAKKGDERVFTGRTGSTLNLLAMDGDAVVNLQGTSWDGDGIKLGRLGSRGMSNQIVSDGALLQVVEGVVLVAVERPKKEYFAT
jgi:thiamine pyrophosphokinase